MGELIYKSVDVAKKMTFCLWTYFPCLIAFAFSFYVLIHANEDFSGPLRNIMVVLVMMTGEMDASHFDHKYVQKNKGRNYSVQIIFIMFLFLISLIINNLLIAVAVERTEDLKSSSKLMQAKRRIAFIESLSYKWYMKVIKIPSFLLPLFEVPQPILKKFEKQNKLKEKMVRNIS